MVGRSSLVHVSIKQYEKGTHSPEPDWSCMYVPASLEIVFRKIGKQGGVTITENREKYRKVISL